MLYGEILYKWICGKITVKEIHDLIGKSITIQEAETIIGTKQVEKEKRSEICGDNKKK